MKNPIIYIFIALLLTQCKKDSSSTPSCPPSSVSIDNEYTINNNDYITPNAYLILDDGPVFTDGFGIALTDGILREDNVNGSSLSTTSQNAVILWVMHGGDVNSEQAVNVSPNTYTLDSESAVLTGITQFFDTYTHNNVVYGEPDADTVNLLSTIENSGTGTLVLNSINIDYILRVGTISCTYSMIDDNNLQVSGSFNGTFDIINEF
jgi:hypothetical protein